MYVPSKDTDIRINKKSVRSLLCFIEFVMRAFAIAALLLCGGTAGEDGTNMCGLYLAKSTIPGAGLGVYTGVDLESKFSSFCLVA